MTLALEIIAAAFGVVGTVLLALNGPRAGWGFVAYLASNAGWILFAWIHAHWGLLAQQIAFTASSLLGVYLWLWKPRAANDATLVERAQLTREPAGWRQALEFYANKDHFNIADSDAWDTVSGEPHNFWCDEAGTATVEDGTVAAMALRGTPLVDTEAAATTNEARKPLQVYAPPCRLTECQGLCICGTCVTTGLRSAPALSLHDYPACAIFRGGKCTCDQDSGATK